MRKSSIFALLVTGGALLGLVGCASAGPSDSAAPKPEGTWQAADPDTAWLTIDDSGKLEANDGCNHFTGTATVVEDEVKFKLDLSTLKACTGVTTSFHGMSSAVIDGDTMTTRDYKGNEIVQLQHRK
jgi:heat shock protein HslJ